MSKEKKMVADKNRKNFTDKNNNMEFETEILFHDKSLVNTKASEQARATSRKPSAINKDEVKKSGSVNKKV